MGEKGARYSDDVGAFAEELAGALQPLGEITWKKMFGGAGLFVDGSMFALVDSDARLHLKVDHTNEAELEALGGQRHGRMPYHSIADDVLADDDRLIELASRSAAIAKGG